MGTRTITRKIMQNGTDELKSFQRGNLSGRVVECRTLYQTGQLPTDLAYEMKQANNLNALYVVYSYQTPIGWCVIDNQTQRPSKWTIPDTTYSVTTTHHQSLLRTMVDNPGFYLKF